VFVNEGRSVVLRAAKSGLATLLTQRFEGWRPRCKRWDCHTCGCEEVDCKGFASSKPYLVVQKEGATGWDDWYFMELEAEALLEVQQELPRIIEWAKFRDCATTSEATCENQGSASG
jgi:hypothetical protein